MPFRQYYRSNDSKLFASYFAAGNSESYFLAYLGCVSCVSPVGINSTDVVVLYTDGITEAFDINRQQDRLERQCEVVSQNCDRTASEIRQAVIEDVRRHIGEQK